MKLFKILKGPFLFIPSKLKQVLLVAGALLGASFYSNAQNPQAKDTIPYYTLDQCIAYALQNQPQVLQSMVNIAITKKTNTINLSGWYPQVNLSADIYHYLQLPIASTELSNTSTPELSITQNIFSPALLYSSESARLLVEQAKQSSDSAKIGIIAAVSKAFYNLLQNLEQISVLKEDTARLGKSVRDAYNQYIGGIVDKTDYKEAIITLNNSKAQLYQAQLNVVPLYAALQQVMGFSSEKRFNVNFDTAQMMKGIASDSNLQLKMENRIEYQLLTTAQKLQEKNVNLYKYNYLPSLYAFYTYNYEFESDNFGDLYTQGYPYSYIGAALTLPIFTGFERTASLQRAKLRGQLLDIQETSLKNEIYSEYTSAMANYKSSLYNLAELKINDAMAKDVFAVVSVQYKQGIVAYLNVITAESNLISAEISYINALFQVLSSKVDLEKALGNISPKH